MWFSGFCELGFTDLLFNCVGCVLWMCVLTLVV